MIKIRAMVSRSVDWRVSHNHHNQVLENDDLQDETDYIRNLREELKVDGRKKK